MTFRDHFIDKYYYKDIPEFCYNHNTTFQSPKYIDIDSENKGLFRNKSREENITIHKDITRERFYNNSREVENDYFIEKKVQEKDTVIPCNNDLYRETFYNENYGSSRNKKDISFVGHERKTIVKSNMAKNKPIFKGTIDKIREYFLG